MTAQIAAAYDSLPPRERGRAAILTSNYGQAGAVERYGPGLGLPTPHSRHNSYWLWGPPPADTDTVVAVGFSRRALAPYFAQLRLAGRLDNGLGVDNDEDGRPIWIARRPRAPFRQIWSELKAYG
jgi:hypothetical protein